MFKRRKDRKILVKDLVKEITGIDIPVVKGNNFAYLIREKKIQVTKREYLDSAIENILSVVHECHHVLYQNIHGDIGASSLFEMMKEEYSVYKNTESWMMNNIHRLSGDNIKERISFWGYINFSCYVEKIFSTGGDLEVLVDLGLTHEEISEMISEYRNFNCRKVTTIEYVKNRIL